MIESLALNVANSLASSFAEKKLGNFFKDKRSDFEKELVSIINNTINQFGKLNPISDSENKIPFYKSELVIQELLKFRLFNEFDRESIISKIDNSTNILPTKTSDITFFFNLFENEIAKSKILKEYEIKDLYPDKIFEISEQINGLSNYLKNLFKELNNAIPALNNEYRASLDEIEKQIFSFMPKSALERIESLENRIKDSIIVNDSIRSRLIYLKALCKSDMSYDRKEVSIEFINAYNTSKQKGIIQQRACVEYLNINEKEKSLVLSEKILLNDEFNKSAWLVKTLLSESDLKESLNRIPNILKELNTFKISVAHGLLISNRITQLRELEDLDFYVNYDFASEEVFDYINKDIWYIKAHLLYQYINEEFPTLNLLHVESRYISNYKKDHLEFAFKGIYNKIKSTEAIKYRHSEVFFYHYINLLFGSPESSLSDLIKSYNNIKKNFQYFIPIIQVLVKYKEYPNAIKVIDEYIDANEDQVQTEIYLFKTVVLGLSNLKQEVGLAYKEYLKFINVIDDLNVINIINLFGIGIAYQMERNDDLDFLQEELDFILNEKQFKNENLKILTEVSIRTRYFNNSDLTSLKDKLVDIYNDKQFNDPFCKFLFAINFHSLGFYDKAIESLNSFLNKEETSSELKFYIECLFEKLQSKDHDGSYLEILNLLQFWRLNSKLPTRDLLMMEFELYHKINDFDKMVEISKHLYDSFPNDEYSLYAYCLSLYRASLSDDLKKLSHIVPDKYKSEMYGLQISAIFREAKINRDKDFQILYNLASNSNNKKSRTTYFGVCNLYEDKLNHFEIVTEDCWVDYQIDSDTITKRVSNESEEVKSILLNRKKGDKFLYTKKVTNLVSEITITDIYNDYVKLFKEIMKEAGDPTSGLGMEMVHFDTSTPESMINQLKAISGYDGTLKKMATEEALVEYYNYQISFTELCRIVFNDDVISAYYFLVFSPNNFMSLSKIIFKNVKFEKDSKYVLDFNSIIFFYDLSENLDMKFNEKFIVSPIVLFQLRKKIVEEELHNGEKMTLDITMNNVTRYSYSEEHREFILSNYKRLESWINENCIIEKPVEKLDWVLKLDRERNDDGLDVTLDHAAYMQRENYKFITNDFFPLKSLPNFNVNSISPEVYLNQFYPEFCNKEYYRFVLKRRFVGITISSELIIEEFERYILGKENVYKRCLLNLQYFVNPDPENFEKVVELLRIIYLKLGITLENKNLYAQEILINFYKGSNKKLIDLFKKMLWLKFHLLGNSWDNVIAVSKNVEEILFRRK